MNNATSVICVKGFTHRDCVAMNPLFRYVGRRTRHGYPETPFGNPFKVGVSYSTSGQPLAVRGKIGPGEGVPCEVSIFTPDPVCWSDPYGTVDGFTRGLWDAFYDKPPAFPQLHDYFRGMLKVLPRLEGCVLGCWCGYYSTDSPMIPAPCHAVILARLLNRGLIMPTNYTELFAWEPPVKKGA